MSEIFNPEDIKKFEFSKLQRCITNAHSSGIGLWAHWWLELYKDGIILDSIERAYNKKKTHYRQADLIFCTSDGRRIGVLEFENDYGKFFKKAKSIHFYDRRRDIFPDLEFGLLVIWCSKKDSRIKKIKKEVNKTKNCMEKYSKNSNLKYILYNPLCDEDSIGFIKKFDQKATSQNEYHKLSLKFILL